MKKIELDFKMSMKMCKKCGKGHDLSAITCAKPRGLDENKEDKQCTGRLQVIQFDEFTIEDFNIVANK